MNYDKYILQKYLKSLQNAGITNCDLNGYQNYINNAKLHRSFSLHSHHLAAHPHNIHPHNVHPHNVPIYAPPSSGYMTNPVRLYTLPHSYQSNYHQDYHYNQNERKSPREPERKERRKKSVVDDANMSYTGVDRDLADSYLKSIEAKEHL